MSGEHLPLTEEKISSPHIPAGIYRHYKGPLYLVIGLAHDANAEEFHEGHYYTDEMPEKLFPDGRTAVVYVPLQLDGAHLGPRMAVRTLEDFNMPVCANVGHVHYGGELGRGRDTCQVVRRFTYLGPELTAEMIP